MVKINFTYVLIAVVIYLVVLVSLSTCVTYIPYSPNGFFSQNYPYEGFQSIGLDYINNNGNVAGDNNVSNLIAGEEAYDCKKVFGISGLFCKPGVADKPLDIYSAAQGKKVCSGYGLSNSNGPLCLNESQIHLLASRGGNASISHPSEIGH